nr:hypothetical protein B0A51_03498 [Rachicladosporium sp. CCFEE 5018]
MAVESSKPFPKKRCGVLGATGSVGQRFILLLNDHPHFTLTAVGASPRSAGKKFSAAASWKQGIKLPERIGNLVVKSCTPEEFKDEVDFVFSGLDSDVAGETELAFLQANIPVFSNSKNYRLDPLVPLVVPTVNLSHLDLIPHQRRHHNLKQGFQVCNSNCAVIGMVVPFRALMDKFGPLERASMITEQAVSGAGYPGVSSLDIFDNIVPYIKGEEEKLGAESRKILGSIQDSNTKLSDAKGLLVDGTCTRVPVIDGHTHIVSLKFAKSPPPSIEEAKEALRSYVSDAQKLGCPSAPEISIEVMEEDDRPQPRLDKDKGKGYTVSVGRVRKVENGAYDLKYVAVSHNLVIGAAGGSILNAEAAVLKVTVVQPDELTVRPDPPPSIYNETLGLSVLAALNGLRNPPLALEIVNHYPGTVNSYVTGKNSKNNVIFLKPDGTFTSIFTSGVALRLPAQGSTLQITLPDYLDSGRIYLAAGDLHFSGNTQASFTDPTDPDAAVQWGLVEFTSSSKGTFADLTFVDFVGLPSGMSLLKCDGTTATIKSSKAGAIASVCSAMKAQSAKDGRPWSSLCQVDSTGKALRVVAPIHHPAGFEKYWNDCVNQVWSHYTSNTLTIDTHSINGKVTCRIISGRLTCDRDEISYGKPTASDIFGCDSGVFALPPAGESHVHKAVRARLCAAFNRATLLIAGGNVQPGVGLGKYYMHFVGNFYARAVHAAEIDRKGYAFAYDDVSTTGGVQQSGMLVDTNGPKKLTPIVGGWSTPTP